MIDLSHLPNSNRIKSDIFYANSTSDGVAWHTWQKPRGINYIQIIAAGGGGGGAAGAVGAAGALGGGGGSAPHSIRNIFLTSALPDILYFSVGYGGAGGTTNAGAGSAGIGTYGAVYPNSANANLLLFSLLGGNAGTSGAGGTVRTATAITSMPLIGISLGGFGQTGNNLGRAGTNPGTNLDIIAANGDKSTNPGTGGSTLPASSFTAGASYIATNGTFGPVFPSHLGGQTSDANGADGYQVPGLFYFYGGTGAASGTASVVSSSGRKGGNGSYGCGGGGGGAAFTGSSVGIGGNGGPGYVIVISW